MMDVVMMIIAIIRAVIYSAWTNLNLMNLLHIYSKRKYKGNRELKMFGIDNQVSERGLAVINHMTGGYRSLILEGSEF